jgi:myo-inositol 2-dehydrogenase/D-chiro-inositol 1-dehydrogenase
VSTAALRTGVLGLGEIGLVHAMNAQRLDEIELVAVASSRPERAHSVADQLGPGVKALSYSELADEEVEAVVVATRTSDHLEHALAVLRHEKHLLLEKPGAPTVAASQALCDAAARHPDLVTMTGYMRRHDPGFRSLREAIQSGRLGDVFAIRLSNRESWPPDEDPAETGGFVLDVGVHDFDTIRWLLRQDPVSLFGVAHASVYPDVDLDNAYLVLELSGGAVATVHMSRTSPVGHDIRCEVLGSKGSAVLTHVRSAGQVVIIGGETSGYFPGTFQERWETAYREELRQFARTCRGESAAGADLDDDRHAVATGVAARASVVSRERLAVGPDWEWTPPTPYGSRPAIST